jgi:hypothetical protein
MKISLVSVATRLDISWIETLWKKHRNIQSSGGILRLSLNCRETNRFCKFVGGNRKAKGKSEQEEKTV